MKRFTYLLTLLLLLSTLGMVQAKPAVVNINKADAAALQQSLIGIGPTKAEAIVSYRKKNGKFKASGDLKNVPGIGPKLIKKNRKYLSTSKGVVKGDAKKYQAAKRAAKAKPKAKAKTTKKK